MYGGLMKTTSRFAIAAAASVLATSAMAADLGGNCCADLEERIAELEATTVRKGNRKVSLTLSGWVHKSVVFWDDGVESNTYAGVDNINSSTRFRMAGDAKIGGDWSAGYLLEIEAFGDINSSQMDQLNPRGALNTTLNTRHSAFWIDNKQLGRVWVGLTDAAGAGIDGINLANTNVAASSKFGLTMNGFRLRGTNGNGLVSAVNWGNVNGGNSGFVNLGDETRNNVIKYVSPTVMGFIFAAAWGEDDFWDVSLKYAGEFNGVRIALGATYAETTDASPGLAGGASNHFNGCVDLANFGIANGNADRDCSSFVLAGSVMHVPTGLFVSGSYGQRKDDLRKIASVASPLVDDTDTFWQVRGGIERNWFGLGKTTLFGEVMNFEGAPISNGGFVAADAGLSTAFAGQTLTGSDISVWGLGVVQSVDAAAMDLYLTFRNHELDLKSSANGVDANKIAVRDYQAVTFGGIIRF